MNDAVLKLGNISIYGFGVLAAFSFLWGSFVFYKKSLESHFDDHFVLDGVVLASFWAVIMGRLAFLILNISTFWNHFWRIFLLSDYPGVNKWGVIAGISLGIYLATRKTKAKFFDWFDFAALGITSGMAVFYSGLSLLSLTWQYFLIAVLMVAFFGIFWKVEDRYRTFSWYRSKKTSARSGLISGLLISCWGLLFVLEMILFSKMNLTNLIGGILLFVGGFVLVYIRSGRTVSEDIKIIFKNGKKQ